MQGWAQAEVFESWYIAIMNIDESKDEQFLSVTQAHAAYLKVRRQLEDALSISGAHAKQSGRRIEVSGATRTPPPNLRALCFLPAKIITSWRKKVSSCLRCTSEFQDDNASGTKERTPTMNVQSQE
jgi:hypothetical protein